MNRQTKKKLVYVAMSGGVDSSVAAALLKKRGFDVVGVFMKPWQLETVSSIKYPVLSMGKEDSKSLILNTKYGIQNTCMWREDREDAMRVAAKLEIPFKTWDFSDEYKKEVTDYMIREYKAGKTPNPDVMCNKHIKFGLFLKKALEEGADYIATGHYARLKPQFSISKFKILNSKFRLFQAKDKNKDQSYFLWTLTQEQLKYCLFPIGDYTKPEVRKIAKKFGLPTHSKKDSQGVCFIGPLDIKDFLLSQIKPKKGKIMNLNGEVMGEHDGIYYYTIGQRHGLNISNGKGPYFVIDKDIKKNIIYVGSNNDLASRKTRIGDINWIRKITLPRMVDVKIRYRASSSKAILYPKGDLLFRKPERAITAGQSAVFYRGQEMIGGGIITN